MARQIDEGKLEAIKKATVEIVVSEGIAGASVSKIAEKANVSAGYLYRFYKGKRELLETLFEERFEIIHNLLLHEIEQQKTVKGIVSIFVETVYGIANNEPQMISFISKLLSDFSFDLPCKFKDNVATICKKVIEIGTKTKEINPKINDEVLYIVIVGGILNFVNIRLRNIFEKKSFQQEDTDHTVELLLKTLI
ncbi:MAG: TetR/AcrR family transcriptional regulator [Flavobacteriaceae bacterium]|nr:TetR/AcrR family transcriptional regulator [Flavobacteriaceae bacterium]